MVETNYNFELNMILPDGGVTAKDVIILYGNYIRDDIDQTAWNLCECDDNLQSNLFGNLTLYDWKITHKPNDQFQIKGKFTVNTDNIDFVSQVINVYMDGFSDYFNAAINGYYSRTGEKFLYNATPIEWDFSIS